MWSSSNSRYNLVSLNDEEAESEHSFDRPIRRKQNRVEWRTLLIGLLVVTNVVSIFVLRPQTPSEQSAAPETLAKIEPLPTIYKDFPWWARYGSHNHTRDNIFWQAINPAHGFVAIDREHAKKNNWPDAMWLPSDHSKGVYLLEAYHNLHCLKILRQTFWDAVEGRPYTYPPGMHHNHCFSSLLQHVVCHADNTPLYTFGDDTSGDRQTHQCRDWQALREYAANNSACYRDQRTPDESLADQFGHCHGLSDGVLDPTFAVDY